MWSKKSWESPETNRSEYKPKVFERDEASTLEKKNLQFKGVDKTGKSGIIKNRKDNAVVISMQHFANKNIPKMSDKSLRKSINSWNERVSEHEDKITNPEKFYQNWNEFDERYQKGLKRHWEHEIKVMKNEIEMAQNELKERSGSK